MKDGPIRYLGLDVHRSTVVASVRAEQGKVVMKATVATEEKAIVALVKGVGPRVHVAFEEGTQAQWLHDLLLGHAERVVVCNVRGRDALRNANDRIDVRRDVEAASRRFAQGGLPRCTGDAHAQELVRCYGNVVQDATRVMLRVKALFRAPAIPTPGVSGRVDAASRRIDTGSRWVDAASRCVDAASRRVDVG